MQPNGVELRRLAVATGITLRVARGGSHGGIPLVLLPGYADSWWSWSRIMPSLVAAFDVLAIDPRGHGGSDRPVCCYRVEDTAADTVAVLDALGISRALIVGHSGSCFAARRIALDHGERVAALILIASPVKLDRTTLGPFIEQVAALEDPVPEAFVREFQGATAHALLADEFINGVVQESLRLPARVWRDALRGLLDFDDTNRLASIHQPTTLAWGDLDGFVTIDDQERLAAAIPGASLVVLPETGHSPHWERPQAVIELVERVARSSV